MDNDLYIGVTAITGEEGSCKTSIMNIPNKLQERQIQEDLKL